MKYNLIGGNGRIAISVFILFQLTAYVFSYQCPRNIHNDCTCEKDYQFKLSCANNGQSIAMRSWDAIDLKIICKNVSSDGQIFELLNFERDYDVFTLELKIDSCPVSVVNKIEDSIIRRTSTNFLDIRADGMSTLPANLFRRKSSLTTLRVVGDELSNLPSNIFENLSSLNLLRISGGNIETLPENILDHNTRLLMLRIDESKLTSLPENMFKRLTLLREINLRGNKLTSLSPNIFKYNTNLSVLKIDGNQLETLPANLFRNHNRIQTMTFIENPWKCDCNFLSIVRRYRNEVYLDTPMCG